jgi:4-hydroxy-tetrahydrodipicolinate synthase
MSFSGTYTALITPFRNGEIDVPAFKSLIDRQIAGGVTGIVPVGTTGESPTLDTDEHIEVIRLAVEFAAGRCEVVAGTGANATAEAIELTEAAEKLGATGTLQVCPYYNKPSQEGLYLHFKAIAESTNLPIMLYSVPGRSSIEIAPETAARLAADCPTVVAIKEAGGSVDRVNQLAQALPDSQSFPAMIRSPCRSSPAVPRASSPSPPT